MLKNDKVRIASATQICVKTEEWQILLTVLDNLNCFWTGCVILTLLFLDQAEQRSSSMGKNPAHQVLAGFEFLFNSCEAQFVMLCYPHMRTVILNFLEHSATFRNLLETSGTLVL